MKNKNHKKYIIDRITRHIVSSQLQNSDFDDFDDFENEECNNPDFIGLLNAMASLENRNIFLFDIIHDGTVKEVVTQIINLEKRDPDRDINLYINSDGGVVLDCLALIDMMNACSCDIATFTVGRAASAACLVASNGTKGKRFAGRNAEFMFHELYGDIPDVTVSDFRYHSREFKRHQQKMNHLFSMNTGRTIKEVREAFYFAEADKDRWMNALESKKFGIIDGFMPRHGVMRDVKKKKVWKELKK